MRAYYAICSLISLGAYWYTKDTFWLFFTVMYVGFADHEHTQKLLKEIKDKLK